MKNFFRIQLCCMGLMILVVAGCKVKRPDSVIPESEMEELLYDYHMAQSLGENLPYSENYKKVLYTEAVFKKHGTTEAVFDSSMVWYTRNMELLSKIYERVTKRLKTEQDAVNHLIAIRDKKPKMSAPGDSVDVWMGLRMAQLTGMPLNDKLTFTLPADTNYQKRDTLQWEVRYHFLEGKPDTTRAAIMAMQIIFENDSIISHTQKVMHSGVERIRLQSDTLGTIKEVKGFIYYPGGKQWKTLLADKISLTRYRCTDTLSVATRDSLRNDSIKVLNTDSLKHKVSKDSIVKPAIQPRLNPEELNKRSDEVRPVRPEQRETEQRIQQEKQQMQRERRTNRRVSKPASAPAPSLTPIKQRTTP